VSTQTSTATLVSTTPSVNLLPPEIAEAAKFRRFQLAMGGVVVLAAAVVGLLYYNAHNSVSNAQNTLSAAQAQNAELQSKVNGLASVKNAYDQVAAYKGLQTEALGNEVQWSFYLADLSLREPNSVWLTQMTVTQAPATTTTTSTVPTVPGATSGTPSSIAPPDQIGTISFQGVALTRDDVAKWLDAMAVEKGWSDPYVSSITDALIGTQKVFDWTGSVYVTSSALSHRYTRSES